MGDIVSLRKTDLAPQVVDACHALSQRIVEKGVDLIISDVLSTDQVECPVAHHFGPGVYVREVLLPAGAFIVGHLHRFAHMNFFVKGRMIMMNEDGSMSDLVAPMTFTSPPGRKMAYIVEDCVWHNIYPTTETDIDVLEDTLLVKTSDWNNYCDLKQKAEIVIRDIDRADYTKVLDEFGLTEKGVRVEVENEEDQMPMPSHIHTCRVTDSPIQGKGFFVTAPVKNGNIIAPANIGGKRTPAGRYTNHSITPNAKMVRDGDNLYLVAIKDLRGCLGGGVGEEVTIDYRQALTLRGLKQCHQQ